MIHCEVISEDRSIIIAGCGKLNRKEESHLPMANERLK
jgi:hypothetical protein